MRELEVSNDTSEFEVPAVLDDNGRLTDQCVGQAVACMDAHGLVILTNGISNEEADASLDLIRQTIDDPARSRSAFASETDNHYIRRDFCSLPSTQPVNTFAAMLCKRLEGVLAEYCGRSRSLLEVATFTSWTPAKTSRFEASPVIHSWHWTESFDAPTQPVFACGAPGAAEQGRRSAGGFVRHGRV